MRSLVLLVILSTPAFASHFDGGTIRWSPVNKSATGSPVQIAITQSYTYTLSLITCSVGSLIGSTIYGFNFSLWCTSNCGPASAGYVAPPVLGYCTGSNTGLDLAFVERTDVVNVSGNASFSISHAIPTTASQGYYRTLALSSGATDSTSQWNITTTIDVRPRADNGLINTPPVANLMSPYGIPYNISTQIPIPTIDVDGDNVRCRWGNSSLECGDVCFPRTIPASTTLSSDCILTITGLSLTGWYCASIQVEDFLNTSTSLRPMSSVPVQFLIYVYRPKNCAVPDLSSSSTCVGVQVGVPYAFNVTAINNCGASSNISSIALQAFAGVVRGSLIQVTPNRTVYRMAITYTPSASQVGLQILCGVALDNTNIPSKQYCITFIVGLTTTPACPSATTTTLPPDTSQVMTSQAQTNGSLVNTTAGGAVTLEEKPWTTEENRLRTTPESLGTTTENLLWTTRENLGTTEEILLQVTSDQPMELSTVMVMINSSTSTRLLSSPSSTVTTSSPRATTINWPLIGTLIGVLSLLALLGGCCVCYHYLWSAKARRRRLDQRHADKHSTRYQPVSEKRINSSEIPRPSKAYQIHDIPTERARTATTNKNHLRTKASANGSNRIRPQTVSISPREPFERTDPDPFPSTHEEAHEADTTELDQEKHVIESKIDSPKESRAKSTISVTRIKTTRGCKSTRPVKARRPSRSDVSVTRVKK